MIIPDSAKDGQPVDETAPLKAPATGTSTQPRYQQIVADLRGNIERGKYNEGDILPSEAELKEMFAVSRHTIREALRTLRNEGYLETRQGAATRIILPQKPLYTYSVNDVAELLQYATDARYQIEKTEIVTADSELAALLSSPEGSRWLRVEGFRYPKGNQTPLCWTEVYILSEYSGVAAMIGRQSGAIYSFIESMYGVRVEQVEQSLYAAPAPAEASIVQGSHGELSIVISRTYRLTDNSIPLVALNYHYPERLRLNWTLRRSSTK